jgi:hypothetical protein
MKKMILLVLFVLLTVSAAFALPELKLSAGAGGMVGLSSAYLTGVTITSGESHFNQEISIFNPASFGGGYAFFDATYAELSLGFSGGPGSLTVDVNGRQISTDFSITEMNIGFLLKWPFGKTYKFKIFPLLGIDYLATLSVKDKDGKKIDDIQGSDTKSSDFSSLAAVLGLGMDIGFTENIYLRFEALFGIRFPSEYEKKTDSSVKSQGDAMAETFGVAYVPIKLALGYRF